MVIADISSELYKKKKLVKESLKGRSIPEASMQDFEGFEECGGISLV